jgi:hypothetical protein
VLPGLFLDPSGPENSRWAFWPISRPISIAEPVAGSSYGGDSWTSSHSPRIVASSVASFSVAYCFRRFGDAAFDRGLISVTDEGVVMASPNLGAKARDVLVLSTAPPLPGLRDAHRAKLAPSPDPERILRQIGGLKLGPYSKPPGDVWGRMI